MWRPPDSESSAHRRRQPRYAGDRVSISSPWRDGFQAPCNEGDGRGARSRRHPGHPRDEGLRGPSKHRRPDPRAPRRSGDQHAVRSWGTDRRLLHQDGGRPGRYTLRDNGAGAPRRAAGDRGAPVRRLRTLQTPCAAGVPCRGAQRPGAGTPGRVERGRFVKRARAEVLNARRFGVYHSITVVAPEVAERARPGQFLSIGMPEGRSFIFRRQFSIHEASRRGGWAGTLEFVFDRHGPGTSWLAGVRVHEFLDVIGPLGTAFAYPAKLNACLLVSEGHASAPMYFLAQELRARGKRVDMIVGAETHEHVFKPIEGKRLSQTFSIVTADGSLGERGTVLDALPGMLETTGAEVVYAAAPRPTLRAIAEMCLEREIPSQIAIEDEMPCGTGLCYTCAIPVIRKDGRGYDNLRACAEGPVFNPARILWDRWIGDASGSAPTPPEGFAKVRTWPG